MDCSEIIRDINSIYQRFRIPPSLQRHMQRVTAVGKVICEHWNGPQLNEEEIVAILLIHDVGNIVKIDFETEQGLKMIGNDAQRLEYWKQVKREIIEKYGKDDHEVTKRMVMELGISSRLQFLMENKEINRVKFVFQSSDWELKIISYADQRVGPFGTVSLKDRFDDLKQRYGNKKESIVSDPQFDIWVEDAFELEKQIFEKTGIMADEVNDKTIKKVMEF